jgi:thymidylate synthase
MIKEICDVPLIINPNEPFMNFEARKYPIDYFKKEMQWKLTADPYNKDIMAHAKMWANVINPDQTYNSNYGQYWFGEQMGIWKVLMELIRDLDSRRAVIPMLSDKHMAPGVKDTVCTECVGFRIRDNYLNMSIHMRSSDAIFGLGTDIPTFAFLYRLLFGLLTDSHPTLKTGLIAITSMSSHIYKQHWSMVETIIDTGGYIPTQMPWCDTPQAMSIIANRGNKPMGYNPLADWLWS